MSIGPLLTVRRLVPVHFVLHFWKTEPGVDIDLITWPDNREEFVRRTLHPHIVRLCDTPPSFFPAP